MLLGARHHIIIRGIERWKISKDDADSGAALELCWNCGFP
jgi:hypothetical protein